MLNRMNQKSIRYKNQVRKQSAPTLKPIIQLKRLGTIKIDLYNIFVHIYNLFGP